MIELNVRSGTFNNQSNEVFLANVAATLAHNGGGPAFNNTGMFIKTNAATLPFSSLPLNNSGTVEVGLGASLTFASGTHTFNAGSSFSGTGAIRFRNPVVLASRVRPPAASSENVTELTASSSSPAASVRA
jgi:hypothetical protein